jgi:hypothetical protein
MSLKRQESFTTYESPNLKKLGEDIRIKEIRKKNTNILINLKSAQNLGAADKTGKSDPTAKCKSI